MEMKQLFNVELYTEKKIAVILPIGSNERIMWSFTDDDEWCSFGFNDKIYDIHYINDSAYTQDNSVFKNNDQYCITIYEYTEEKDTTNYDENLRNDLRVYDYWVGMINAKSN